MAWVPNHMTTSGTSKSADAGVMELSGAAGMDGPVGGENGKVTVEDYDLAEEDEGRWLAE